MGEGLIQVWIPQFFLLVMMGIGFLLISKRIDDLRTDTMSRLSEMSSRMERLENRQAELERVIVGKFEEVDSRLARIESHLAMR